MIKWEYKKERHKADRNSRSNDSAIEKSVLEAGKEGWELVSVNLYEGKEFLKEFYYKRPIHTSKGKIIDDNYNKYEGDIKNGKFHGQGIFTCPNGEHKEYKSTGMYGVEHYKYEGSWKENMEDGYGTATWENVNEDADYRIIKYEGWWKKGEQHGHGKITWEKPYDAFPKEYENYLGWWKEGVFHGRGVHYLGYGEKYDGEYKEGEMHGFGEYTFKNGDRFVGDFKNGKRHGLGNLWLKSGDKYEGEWKYDRPHGQSLFTYSNGDTFLGSWSIYKYPGEWQYDLKHYSKHGQGTFTYADGKIVRGIWENGEKI